MAKMMVEVEVSKETYELGKALVGMVDGVKKALDDGWQLGEDLPKIISAVVSNLGQAVEGVKEAPEEWKEDPEAFVSAIALSMADMVEKFKG